MRFLPIHLDMRTGPILPIGAGEPVRAKLRATAAAQINQLVSRILVAAE